jgi:phenylacetate-CoA ligase
MITQTPDIIWDAEHETMPRDQLEVLQYERLRDTVERVYRNVPFYRRAMDEKGIRPSDIGCIDDLQLLPFTNKQDLRDNYPFGMFAVPRREVVRVHASSGTTGKPTVVGYTRRDLETWAECVARALSCGGATVEDVVHVAYGYGLFTGGLGLHCGAERVGCTVIPVSGGNTKRQVMLMQDFGATILACTPSFSLHLQDVAEEMGVSIAKLPLRVGIFGAEAWSERMRWQIEEKLGILALDIYGLSEVMGPGVSNECHVKQGLHVFDDHFIPEIIDPVTGERLPDGEKGELVFTTITKEALPLLRYRTRDISRVTHEPCACGRTSARMERVTGRADDMLIIRGVNVFPSQIETALLEIEEVAPHYVIIVDRQKNLDYLEVWVEVAEQHFSDEIRRMEELRARVTKSVDSMLGINVRIKLVEPKSIQRSEGKAKRVIDKREI